MKKYIRCYLFLKFYIIKHTVFPNLHEIYPVLNFLVNLGVLIEEINLFKLSNMAMVDCEDTMCFSKTPAKNEKQNNTSYVVKGKI